MVQQEERATSPTLHTIPESAQEKLFKLEQIVKFIVVGVIISFNVYYLSKLASLHKALAHLLQ